MAAMKRYKKRIFDALLADALEAKGAVLLQGPKWCGKTTTAEQVAKSVLYMADPEKVEQNLLTAETRPRRLLRGESPRLIDEWQIAPGLWDAVRFDIDHADRLGKYILTGSAVPPDKGKIRHTGTGRFAWLTMRPMSLYESLESKGGVSLADLFAGRGEPGDAMGHSLEEVAYLACRGGWPQATGMSGKAALRQASDYVDAIAESDISRADGTRRDPATARRILRSLARLQGTQASVGAVRADLAANETRDFHENTVYAYIGALKKIFVVEDMEAWCPNLRCKTPVRTADTRYFTDPSIAAAALGMGPDDLMDDLKTFGFVFETLVARDLRTYAAALGGQVFHYKDKSGLECDAVVHLRNGRYGLVEVKLGGERLIAEGERTLDRLAGEIDTQRMRPPSFRMVVVAAGDFAHVRPGGVVVCPIGALRP
jgi:hypothetical protein